MSKKQTAVEWLFQQLWETPKDKLTWYSILKEVKAMEKEQTLLFSEKYDEYVFRGGSATAEEWFANSIEGLDTGVSYQFFQEMLEQAKEMEKEQMKEAVLSQVTKQKTFRSLFEKQFEQYYNETFKSE